MSYCDQPPPIPMDIIRQKRHISKSENEIFLPYSSPSTTLPYKHKQSKPRRLDAGDRISEQYYKRYDHDEVPVKDSSGKLNIKLTDSKLNAIEKEALRDIDEPILPRSSSNTDANLTIFKITVQEILSNFFTKMEDFEDYKRRFYELLNKDPRNSTAGMEEFIKDMIKHIVSQSTISNTSNKTVKKTSAKDVKTDDMMMTDTTTCMSSVRGEYNPNRESNFTTLCDRNSLDSLDLFKLFISSNDAKEYARSEMLLNSSRPKNRQVTSADDINKFLTEKLELEGFIVQQMKSPVDFKDTVIPMKNTSPKMDFNIVKAESISQREFKQRDTNTNNVIERDNRKSFLSKICGFFCRKLRRYSIN